MRRFGNAHLFSKQTIFFWINYLMEVLFSVKIFDVEFSPDLYVLRSPEYKKVVFGNWSVRMYVGVGVTAR